MRTFSSNKLRMKGKMILMKMNNPELEVVRFGAEDVIATSGYLYSITGATMSSAGKYNSQQVMAGVTIPMFGGTQSVTFADHNCNNPAEHAYAYTNEGNYGGVAAVLFTSDGDNYTSVHSKQLSNGGSSFVAGNYYYSTSDTGVYGNYVECKSN